MSRVYDKILFRFPPGGCAAHRVLSIWDPDGAFDCCCDVFIVTTNGALTIAADVPSARIASAIVADQSRRIWSRGAAQCQNST